MAVTRRKTPTKKAAPKKKPAAGKAATSKATARKDAPKKAAPAKPAPRKPAAKKPAPKKQVSRKPPAPRTSGLAGDIKPYKPKRGEAYMNKPQRAHFEEILVAWKRELMEEVDRTVHHMQDEASNFPDPNDRASQESEFSLELRTRDRERKLLRKIDEALKALEINEYGWCESCGSEIGIRRLEARPTASLCIDCKTLDEIRERQIGG